MTESNSTTSNPLLDILPKLSNYLFGITLLCYGAGFAITNIYLGSMGIVTFDILRSRYILAGLLFFFFLGSIIFLTNGLIQTLRKNYQKPPFKVIWEVIWFSLTSIGLLYFVIPAIGIFAGTTGSQNYSPPQLTQPEIPWSIWLEQAPLSILHSTNRLSLAGILTLVLFVLIFVVINPKGKEGKREARLKILANMFKAISENKWKIITTLITAYILLYLLNLSSSLFSFYLAGKLPTTPRTSFTFPNGWAQLFNSITIIYILIALYLTFIALFPPSITEDSNEELTPNFFTPIYVIALGIITIVPLYVSRVYPVLPQQIGGGQLIKVQVVVSDYALESQFSNSDTNTYLIDRTSSSYFFMLQKKDVSEYKIMEIKNELVHSVIYDHFP